MTELTALCFVAPITAVVDPITHPEVWLAEPVLTSELVLPALCGQEKKDAGDIRREEKAEVYQSSFYTTQVGTRRN